MFGKRNFCACRRRPGPHCSASLIGSTLRTVIEAAPTPAHESSDPFSDWEFRVYGPSMGGFRRNGSRLSSTKRHGWATKPNRAAIACDGGPNSPSKHFHFLPFPSFCDADSRLIKALRGGRTKKTFPADFPSGENRQIFENSDDEHGPCRLEKPEPPLHRCGCRHPNRFTVLSSRLRSFRLERTMNTRFKQPNFKGRPRIHSAPYPSSRRLAAGTFVSGFNSRANGNGAPPQICSLSTFPFGRLLSAVSGLRRERCRFLGRLTKCLIATGELPTSRRGKSRCAYG